jgi:hypothetical protein
MISNSNPSHQAARKACISALFLITNITLNTVFPRTLLLGPLLGRLRSSLEDVLSTLAEDQDSRYKEIMLWVLSIGAHAASLVSLSEFEQFSKPLQEVSEILGLRARTR